MRQALHSGAGLYDRTCCLPAQATSRPTRLPQKRTFQKNAENTPQVVTSLTSTTNPRMDYTSGGKNTKVQGYALLSLVRLSAKQ